MSTALLDRSRLGHWIEPRSFAVTRESISEYAEATNDEEEQHRSGEVAPPVFAVAAALEALDLAGKRLAPDEVFLTSLHGAQDLQIAAALIPGTTVKTRARPRAIQVGTGGTTVVLESETHGADQTLLNRQYMSLFFPGVRDGESVGEPAPPHRLDPSSDAAIVRAYPVDRDQARRFAAASGDFNPMHLDATYARQAGFPDVLLHGLCTMAFCGRAVIAARCPHEPGRLARLALRFARPVYPGQTVTTSIWAAAPLADRDRFVLRAATSLEVTVIKDGLAEVRRGRGVSSTPGRTTGEYER